MQKIITIFFLISFHSLFAQDTNNLEVSQHHFGVDVKYGATQYKNDREPIRCEKGEIPLKSAFTAGLFYEYKPLKWFSLYTGLGYNYFSSHHRIFCNSDDSFSEFYPVGTPNTSIKFDYNYFVNLHSLYLPLLIQFQWKWLQIGFGVQSNIILGGKYKYQQVVTHSSYEVLNESNGYYHNQFQWGGIAQVGFTFLKNWSVNLKYYHSLHDMNSNAEYAFAWKKEWMSQYLLGLSYTFFKK